MKLPKKVILSDIIPTSLIAVLIIIFAIVGKQSFIKTLPTLVSLVVQLMLIKVNRYAFLIGGLNAVLYSISYYNEALYFSFFSALAISAPLQLVTFATWTRRSKKGTVKLRRVSCKMRLLIVVVLVLSWLILFKTCSSFLFASRFAVLDSLTFVCELAALILSIMRLIESRYANLLACVLALAMWIALCIQAPQNINFLIISAYNLFRVAQATIIWTKTYISGEKEIKQQ